LNDGGVCFLTTEGPASNIGGFCHTKRYPLNRGVTATAFIPQPVTSVNFVKVDAPRNLGSQSRYEPQIASAQL